LTAPLLLALLLAAAPAAEPGKHLVLSRTVSEFGPKPAEKKEKRKEKEGEPAPAAKPEIVEISVKHYTVKMAPGRLRESCLEDDTVTVVREDKGLLWLLHPQDKTYREISLRKLSELSEKARQRLIRRLPLVEPSAHKDRLKALLGLTDKPPEISIEERPEERKKIAGESCRKVVVRLGGEKFFEAYISRRKVPLAGARWLLLGGILSREAARKLSGIKGLLMEAVFPLPRGGRLEISTQRVAERPVGPNDYRDPAELGYRLLYGGRKVETKARGESRGEKGRPKPGKKN